MSKGRLFLDTVFIQALYNSRDHVRDHYYLSLPLCLLPNILDLPRYYWAGLVLGRSRSNQQNLSSSRLNSAAVLKGRSG